LRGGGGGKAFSKRKYLNKIHRGKFGGRQICPTKNAPKKIPDGSRNERKGEDPRPNEKREGPVRQKEKRQIQGRGEKDAARKKVVERKGKSKKNRRQGRGEKVS